jgi:small subunit ribosomal protein S3
MGHKINPTGMRVGIIRDWDAKWYANKKDFATTLHEDLKLREYIEAKLAEASISRVEIERTANRVNISIHTAKPGMVIGKGGSEVDALRNELSKIVAKGERVHINIIEIKKPDLDAHLVGSQIAADLVRRVAFRRAKGIKTQVSGRLNGADMARIEQYTEGTVPLHTLRADIDYSWDEATTTYGQIGVKTWIYRGDILPEKKSVKKQGGE